MNAADLVFTFYDYWHIGSGTGSGAGLDALVLKDGDNLPFVPGRTVKGMLREAVQTAEDVGALAENTTAALFGDPGRDDDRFGTTEGTLRFSSAEFGEGFRRWAEQNPEYLTGLYRELSMTAIDDHGVALKHSLRRIELTVPVQLRARVTPLPDCPSNWLEALKTAAPLIRRMGSHRNRGFGRVQVCVEEVSA